MLTLALLMLTLAVLINQAYGYTFFQDRLYTNKKAFLTWLFLWKHIWKLRIQNEVDMQSATHFTVFKTVKCMTLHKKIQLTDGMQ